MNLPTLSDPSDPSNVDSDNRITAAVIDALESNDKTIEIRPATQSSGRSLPRLLLLVAGVVAVGYWIRTSQRPDSVIESAKNKTADRSRKAKATVQDGSETVAERVEEGSEKASDMVEEAGENAADEIEEAGETADDSSRSRSTN